MAVTEGRKAKPWLAPGRYHVSHVNYNDEVQAAYKFPEKMRIHEATLRKIEHAAGVPEYTTGDKVEIARHLDAVGVEELGVNPGQYSETVKGESELEGIRAVCKAGLRLKVRGQDHDFRWIRGDYSYIDRLADAGTYGVDLIIGSQATDLVWGTGKASVEQTEKPAALALEYIRRKGLDAGVTIADIGRVDLDRTLRHMNSWLDHGAERFHLVDSLGTLGPEATRYLVHTIRKALKRAVPTAYHVHNDFGMATACAIAAASAGAWPETSVNGFADRGFASFEEVVLSLELLYGVDTGIKLEGLAALSAAVERITRSKNHPNKPVIGEAVWVPQFTTQYLEFLKDKDAISTYISSFNPELIGARVKMMWSANTLSRDAIEAKLNQMGLPHVPEDVATVLTAVHERLRRLEQFPLWISDSEVEEICHRLGEPSAKQNR